MLLALVSLSCFVLHLRVIWISAIYRSNSPKLKHSTVKSIAFCMRKNAPTDVSVSKSFPG